MAINWQIIILKIKVQLCTWWLIFLIGAFCYTDAQYLINSNIDLIPPKLDFFFNPEVAYKCGW